MSAHFNLTGDHAILQGATWRREFHLKDPSHVVTIGGSPAGGSFRLAWRGRWTENIAHNASAAAVQAALELLPTVGQGNVTVTGNAGGPYTITFDAALRARVGNPGLEVDGTNLLAYGGSISAKRRPLDLTGYTARMQARSDVDDAATLFSLTSGAGDIAIDAAGGKVTVTIAASATAGYTWKWGVWDLELVSAGGEVARALYGDVEVSN